MACCIGLFLELLSASYLLTELLFDDSMLVRIHVSRMISVLFTHRPVKEMEILFSNVTDAFRKLMTVTSQVVLIIMSIIWFQC